MPTNYDWLLHMDGEERQAWFDAEHVDANDDLAPESDVRADAVDANDETATCNNSGDFVTHDSREKLEDDIYDFLTDGGRMGVKQGELMTIIGWLDRQAAITAKQLTSQFDASKPAEPCEINATKDDIRDFDDSREKLEDKAFNLIARMVNEAYTMGAHEADWSVNRQSVRNCITELFDGVAAITRKTEQAAWIQQANGLIHEANARADELRDELAKRDKGIERLKRQRDTARAKIDELHAECDTCCYKTDYIEMDFYDVERLEAERDALAADLRDCERQRERLRQALGCAIDHAHEVVSLVNLDGEVIG